jgi:hypothetical protein
MSGKSFREGKSSAITARTVPRAGLTAITGPLATNGAGPLPPQAADPAQRVISAHAHCARAFAAEPHSGGPGVVPPGKYRGALAKEA